MNVFTILDCSQELHRLHGRGLIVGIKGFYCEIHLTGTYAFQTITVLQFFIVLIVNHSVNSAMETQ